MEHKEKHTYHFYIQIKIQQKVPLIVSSQSQTGTKSEAITMKNRWMLLKKYRHWEIEAKDGTMVWSSKRPNRAVAAQHPCGLMMSSGVILGLIYNDIYIYHSSHYYLVGGLEHFLFFHILGIIIPTDFHIFQRA